MQFDQLVELLKSDTTGRSLALFAPELVLCVTIVALLLGRLCGCDRKLPTYWTSLIGALIAFGLSFAQFVYLRGDSLAGLGTLEWLWWPVNAETGAAVPLQEAVGPFFTGLLVFDKFTVFFRLFLMLFLILVIALTVLSGIPDNEDGPDFYTLLLGSTVGMMLMAGANHLLILFLAVEMTSVPSYAMVGFLKGRRTASEASLKYVVYGAGAAGVMLYGISLLCGLLGTAELPLLAERLQTLVAGQEITTSNANVVTVVLAFMMVLVGLAFKLSVVPFHFWCPDAFEGAAAEVGGFLSVASKGAAFALLVRFCLALGGHPSADLSPVYMYLGIAIATIAAVTATFGNLAAYAQTNVKRLLAYSTIAHAGYMLMAVGAMLVLLNGPDGPRVLSATDALQGLLYYLSVYLFMNLGAFAIVALIRNEIFSEEIADYDGLIHQSPVLCVGMLICMFSLVGMPPLGGFVGKFMIFAALFDAGKVHWSMWVILVVGGVNTVFSLFYYLRVLKGMFLADRPEAAREARVPATSAPGLYVLLISLPVLVLGIAVERLSVTAQNVAAVIVGQ